MTFENIVMSFIDSIEADKSGGTPLTYKRKIYVFQEYVILKLEARDVNFKSILSAMSIKQLVEAVEYYVVTYDIHFAATVETYITVIGAFFDFISSEYSLVNPVFEQKSKKSLLKSAFTKKIKDMKLNDKKQIYPLTSKETNQLLKVCNEKLNNYYNTDKLNDKEFSEYTSSIICKLMLLYGTKNGCINKLSVKNFDCKLNKLEINKFWIHLPDQLAIQMKKYLNIRKDFLGETEENLLFIDLKKKSKMLDNNKMLCVLNEVTGKIQGASISKFAIIEMIKLGVPSHIIKEFTGYSEEVFKHCQELVDEEDGILVLSEKSKLLDSSLRKSQLYDRL